MSAIPLSLEALVGLCVLFGLVYALARGIDNYGIVDIAWSYSFGLLALIYSLFGAGWPVRRALIAAMVTVWSIRLGTHLLVRIARKHPEEDGRYRQLRKDWGSGFTMKMAGFFQLQAVSVVVLGIPFLAACSNTEPALHPLECCGATLWLVAISGEALSDAQLLLFKRNPKNSGAVCDVGLWHYSRHPNYFFEWLIWVSYFLFACGSPWGWIGILSPLSILYLLLRVTGIPATEEQSVRSKGAAYRRYQERTSAFVPLPTRAHTDDRLTP
jgi:steroid 5-alpha reductase family enzyme